MKKLLSIALSMVLMLSMIVTALPAVSAETTGADTYAVTILNKTDAVISNTSLEVKKGDSYSTTIAIKNKDEMGEIKVGVIMDDGTIVEPKAVDDYTLSVDIPKVTGNLYISAYTASKTGAVQVGSSGYGEIVRVLENVVSDMPNVKYYSCEDYYLPNGSFYFEETFTPKEGYEIKEIKAVNTCAYLYDTVNYYGEPLAKGYDYREQDMLDGESADTLTKNEDGSYTLKYMPSGSMFVKVVAEKKATSPKLTDSSISLKAGDSKVISVVDGTAKAWATSNKNVATVNNGKVTAVGKGTATITATLTTGEKLTCKVTVSGMHAHPSVGYPTNITVNVGSKIGWDPYLGKWASCVSSNKNVATVNSNKVIKGISKGKAVISIKAKCGCTAKCTVTVKQPVTKIKLSLTKKTLKVKESCKIKAVATPGNANNSQIKWTTSNKKVACVTKEKTKSKGWNCIKAKKKGSAVIKAKAVDGSKTSAICKVTVK